MAVIKEPSADYLRAHGITSTPAELHELIVHAVDGLGRILAYEDATAELTGDESRILSRAGFDLKPRDAGRSDPIAQAVAAYVALLETALTTEGAAELLGVEASRIRQRLTSHPPSLYGIKVTGAWRVPVFQFDGGSTIPGLEEVLAALDDDLHPLALFQWFTSPHPDLESGATGTLMPLSPRDWLRLGLPAEAVAAMARDL